MATEAQQFVPNDKQIAALKLLADPFFTRYILDGGARSGKTVVISRFLVNRAVQYPGSKQLVARLRLTDCMQSARITVEEYLLHHVPKSLYRWIDKKRELIFRNGSKIRFEGLDSKERIDFVLGTEWLTIFVNEVTQITFSTLLTLRTRLAQSVRHVNTGELGVPKLIVDCNPKHRRHWVHLVCIDNPALDPNTDPPQPLPDGNSFVRLNWSIFDNLHNLPPTVLAEYDSLPLVLRCRMRDGVWQNNEGAVYDEFDEDIHVIDPFQIPNHWRLVRGIDFGYTNPFGCLWGALDEDGRLFFWNEHYERGVLVEDHAKAIIASSRQARYEWTVADWDAEGNATLAKYGVKTVKASKEIITGIQRVKRRLLVQRDGRPRMFFFRGVMRNTIGEFYAYKYAPDAKPAKNSDEIPIPKNDHAMDIIRYIVNRLDGPGGTSRVDSPGSSTAMPDVDSSF